MDSLHVQNLGERYTAAWCSGNAASVAAHFEPGGSLQVNDSPAAVGREAIAAVAQSFMTAFPDMTVAMDGLIVDGDRAVYHWTLTGSYAETGRHVRISGFEEWRIGGGGLIAQSLGHFDSAEYQRQLHGGAGESPA